VTNERVGMSNLTVLIASAGSIYLALSILIAVIPGVAMSKNRPGPGVEPLTAQQEAGFQTYLSEGCSYCHTQQVRPISSDAVFGRPSTAGDYAYQTPEVLASERNGPDLTNEGAHQPSDVWQLIHLYNPRALVQASIMPRYPWLFTTKRHPAPGDVTVALPPGYAPAGKTVVATQQALDLVAYLKSLKQAPLPTPRP
jgi:cytochrome c oxidase cbb3-type subunit II